MSLDEGHGLPAKDVPILAAVGAQCEVLLTGDIADFGHAINRSLQGVRIPTASLLLAELDCPLTSKWRIQALARIAGGVRRGPEFSGSYGGACSRRWRGQRSASSIGSSPPAFDYALGVRSVVDAAGTEVHVRAVRPLGRVGVAIVV